MVLTVLKRKSYAICSCCYPATQTQVHHNPAIPVVLSFLLSFGLRDVLEELLMPQTVYGGGSEECPVSWDKVSVPPCEFQKA